MKQPRKCTAIKSLLFLALMWTGALAYAAQAAGTVINLSGPLLAKKADGTIRILALKSAVEPGDTLVTQKNGYAQIKFSDDSRLILQPNTTLTIDKFSYDATQPDDDSAAFTLIQGGLRSITGLLGKRNKEKFSLKTPTAAIDIRGTTFIAQYVNAPQRGDDAMTAEDLIRSLMNTPQAKSPAVVSGNSGGDQRNTPPPVGKVGGSNALPPSAPQLPPGLHVQVTDGMIVVTNSGGSLGFQAGQFGYVPSMNQPPVIVPPNPNMQFVPPPSFNAGAAGPTSVSGSVDRGAVDCVVR
jgi:hypothetical protein